MLPNQWKQALTRENVWPYAVGYVKVLPSVYLSQPVAEVPHVDLGGAEVGIML